MTRTVTDAALMLQVIAQPDPRDWTDIPQQPTDFRADLDTGIAGLRIGFSPDLGYATVDDDVARTVRQAVTVFEELGAHVEDAAIDIGDRRTTIETLWAAADAWLLQQIPADRHADIDPGLRAMADQGRGYSSNDYIDALAARSDVAHRLGMVHERYDLLLTPQMPLTAFEAGHNAPPGRDMDHWLDWNTLTYPFNLSHQPAASIPCGFGDNGMPVGLQVVGPRFADALVLRACRAYEQAHPIPMPDAYRA
jgi:aspartyl-tRNA(Asn)/glutamyl-tRNA(Gln) amidotransferase subunit A